MDCIQEVREIFFDIFGYMWATRLYSIKEGRKESGENKKEGANKKKKKGNFIEPTLKTHTDCEVGR